MEKEWVVSMRDQCKSEGVPFFFKQWGGVRKKAAGRKLDGKTFKNKFPGAWIIRYYLRRNALHWPRNIQLHS